VDNSTKMSFGKLIHDMYDPNLKTWKTVQHVMCTLIVATLALGSRPRQRGCKGAGQEEARESHQRLPGV
jgi:hypothetical protein